MINRIVFLIIGLITVLVFSPVAAQAEKVYWIAYIAIDDTFVPGKCMRGLCLVRSDNRENKLLTEDVTSYSQFAWSHDGKWIAYSNTKGDLYRIQIEDKKPVLIADRWKLLTLAGMKKDQIEEMKSLEWFIPIYDIVWSLDGTELFLGLSPWFPSSLPPINIYRINIEGTNFREIVHLSDIRAADRISLSPDRKWLAYLDYAECRYCDFRGGNLYKVRPDGSGKKLLLDKKLNVGAYVWSSTDNIIYYSYWEEDESWSIYSINLDTFKKELLLKNIDYGGSYGPTMTINNNHLYYLTSKPKKFQKLYIVNLIDGQNKIIPNSDLGEGGFKTISASSVSGRVLTVGSDLQVTHLNGDFLYILDESGNLVNLIGYPIKKIDNPIWSPVPIA